MAGTSNSRNTSFRRALSSGVWLAWKRILSQDDYYTLFQFANDGKTAVATAVTAKGVTASSADTFAALARKIGQIATGKKWASGSGQSSNFELSVSGLGFTP